MIRAAPTDRPRPLYWRAEPTPSGGVRLAPVHPFPEAILLVASWSERLDSTASPVTGPALARRLAASPLIHVQHLGEKPN